MVFPGGPVLKNPPANARDADSIPGLVRSPRGGNGNPLQYFCPESSVDRRDWQAQVHGVTNSPEETEHARKSVYGHKPHQAKMKL